MIRAFFFHKKLLAEKTGAGLMLFNFPNNGNFFYGVFEPHETTCPRCLRSRENVWPLQYVVKREPWDGIRHDEV